MKKTTLLSYAEAEKALKRGDIRIISPGTQMKVAIIRYKGKPYIAHPVIFHKGKVFPAGFAIKIDGYGLSPLSEAEIPKILRLRGETA